MKEVERERGREGKWKRKPEGAREKMKERESEKKMHVFCHSRFRNNYINMC